MLFINWYSTNNLQAFKLFLKTLFLYAYGLIMNVGGETILPPATFGSNCSTNNRFSCILRWRLIIYILLCIHLNQWSIVNSFVIVTNNHYLGHSFFGFRFFRGRRFLQKKCFKYFFLCGYLFFNENLKTNKSHMALIRYTVNFQKKKEKNLFKKFC